MQLSCYLFHFSDLKFEDTTEVIRNRKLKKGRQYNGKKKKKKKKRPSSCRQNITQKIKVRATLTPLKTGVNSVAPEGSAFAVPIVEPIVLLLKSPFELGCIHVV